MIHILKQCSVCGQEYNGKGISYELRDDKGKVIETGQGHEKCIQPKMDEMKSKFNKEEEKK